MPGRNLLRSSRGPAPAYLEHERAKAELKSLVPEDAQQAIGHGIRAKRSKSGAISFDLLDAEAQPCSGLVNSIASLAAALAKAQVELVNPEKSLVATIRADGPREAERTFRYAPLSSGLDIVRKILGQHEIATVQTTSIDQSRRHRQSHDRAGACFGRMDRLGLAGLRRSARRRRPHRMGAALTYARRYALFTLVGIAGEDDLDAPDLNAWW